MIDPELGILIGAIGTAVGVAGGVAATVFKQWSNNKTADAKKKLALRKTKQEERKAALAGYQKLIEDMEKQGDRREHILQTQQTIIEGLQHENVECREESAELRKTVYFIYDVVKRLHKTLVDAGRDPGPLLELPPMRDRSAMPGAEFLNKQTQQNTTLLHAVDNAIAANKEKLDESSPGRK